ncbi:ABC transporter substrate-binding protein [Rhodoligotrophos defluvii]|uniref:ABC transporter substrate-binding protein n=1 Tax=Rhodoligotrophos defluvii TaxID=2561934 RepID=UPI001484D749|nr:ABC transporter substrate-binding protein [Rhodoligotrophos defluvii]
MYSKHLSRVATAVALAIAIPIAGASINTLAPVPAQAASAAESLVENFHAGLLAAMKQASSLGYAGRYKKLEPLVKRTFGMETMVQIIVGPEWSKLSAAERQALVAAFSDWVVANYASRFNGWEGESFVTTGVTDGGRNTVVVQTEIRPQNVKLGYRVLNGKVVDVYLSGSVSQLAQWRSEFASVLKQQGAQGLAAKLKTSERQLAN